ncbi:MAG: PilZ domain-containing protein [Candidatus Gastranaerophilales bacterium]|nr:PilZ domain-containing protein [Candidatus Gastranaerophilales bacterium]
MGEFLKQFKDFKSFEVIFHDENNQLQKIYCTVISIQSDCVILHADNERNNNILAKEDDSINIRIYTDNGVYSSESKILSVTPSAVLTEYIIAYPENSNHSQRREYFRADMTVDFKLEIETKDAPGTRKVIQAQTRDISGKGLSFISDKPLPAVKSAIVELYFDEKNIKSTARLVYSKELGSFSGRKFLNAFHLINISQKDIDFIVKKCFLYQLELRKKSRI